MCLDFAERQQVSIFAVCFLKNRQCWWVRHQVDHRVPSFWVDFENNVDGKEILIITVELLTDGGHILVWQDNFKTHCPYHQGEIV